MAAQTVRKIEYNGIIQRLEFSKPIPAEPEPKLKKDGTPKNIICNKKRGRKSEVYPYEVEDIKKMMEYFKNTEQWNHYLIFVMSCNMARRIGDTLSLQWKHVYDQRTGKIRKDLLEIVEDKTDKLANPHINSAVRAAIELYIQKTHCNPAENNYENFIFMQLSGTYKGRRITDDGHRKALKKAAIAIGIEYNIGTHSARKTFGKLNRALHPGDYDSMEILQTIYNHSDTKTTKHYIGLTKQKIDQYYNDFGTFFDDYITGDKVYEKTENNAMTVNLTLTDIRDIIKSAYESGIDNSGINDVNVHIETINAIMNMVEKLAK